MPPPPAPLQLLAASGLHSQRSQPPPPPPSPLSLSAPGDGGAPLPPPANAGPRLARGGVSMVVASSVLAGSQLLAGVAGSPPTRRARSHSPLRTSPAPAASAAGAGAAPRFDGSLASVVAGAALGVSPRRAGRTRAHAAAMRAPHGHSHGGWWAAELLARVQVG
jgi:hypothetical protein